MNATPIMKLSLFLWLRSSLYALETIQIRAENSFSATMTQTTNMSNYPLHSTQTIVLHSMTEEFI